MISRSKIARINELARRSGTPEGLSEEEQEEQRILRREYIEAFKADLRRQLDRIEIVDPERKED